MELVEKIRELVESWEAEGAACRAMAEARARSGPSYLGTFCTGKADIYSLCAEQLRTLLTSQLDNWIFQSVVKPRVS